jgi:hypothetical protein
MDERGKVRVRGKRSKRRRRRRRRRSEVREWTECKRREESDS